MTTIGINNVRRKSSFSLLWAVLAIVVHVESASAGCGDYLHVGGKEADLMSADSASLMSTGDATRARQPLSDQPIPDSPCRQGNCHGGPIPSGPAAPVPESTVDRDHSGLDTAVLAVDVTTESGPVRSMSDRLPLNPSQSIDRPPE